MIVSVILYILYGTLWIITAPLRALPNATLPLSLSTAITQVNGYLSAVHAILPNSTYGLLAMLGMMFTFEIAVFGYKVIMWVIHRIPGQGGGSPG